MPRRREGQPVENEERVAVAALRLSNLSSPNSGDGHVRFWVKDVQAALAHVEPGAVINDSTVNRALNRLVSMGWMWAAWETADPENRLSSKPRLYFRLTDEGRAATRELVVSKRNRVPLWVLRPDEVLGEPIEDNRWDRAARATRRGLRHQTSLGGSSEEPPAALAADA